MNKSYYPKLAASNLKKNKQVYLPYMIACTAAITMFFILQSLAKNACLLSMRGGNSLISILNFGTRVIAIFSVILLFYTNSFLIKRRKKEIGLYNILGMEKKHLAFMMTYETLFTYGICISIGLIIGMILNKLMFLLLLRILQFDVHLKFHISLSAIVNTAILFMFIFLAMLVFNLLQIHLAKPVELLSADKSGEKEPKGKLISTILGIVLLAGGYAIALFTEEPISAIPLFFVAILLVITGTYLLFTTGSIAFLKRLKRNKKYYYKTEHFISTSSMIYRMKQNAVGLASICILSTAVLLILSTTVSVYGGMNDILKTRFPREVAITLENPTEEAKENLNNILNENYATYQVEPKDITAYPCAFFAATKENDAGNKLNLSNDEAPDTSLYCGIYMFSLADYNKLTGKNISLAPNEALICMADGNYSQKTINLNGDVYKNVGDCSDFPDIDPSYSSYMDLYYIVLPDAAQILAYNQIYNENPGKTALDEQYEFNIVGKKQNVHDFSVALFDTLNGTDGIFIECREESKESFFATFGSLLFIGIFLGALFLGATVLIIYYKQISEGFDDRERYALMEKVGLSKDEIKKTIHNQILKVFFLPLVMAIIHIVFAFKMMVRLLSLLCLTNVTVFFLCTVITIVIFGVIYSIVYGLTAKTYYKIVE